MRKVMGNQIFKPIEMFGMFCVGFILNLLHGDFLKFALSFHPLLFFSWENIQKLTIYFTKGAVQGTGAVVATLIVKAAWNYSPADSWIKRIVQRKKKRNGRNQRRV